MPGGGGLQATREIVARYPTAAVLVMTMFEDDDSVFAAMRAGARGYVLKDMDTDDLTRAIVAVGRGEAIFSPGIAVRMARFFTEREAAPVPFPDLTDSERKVLTLMAAGENNAAIASQLFYSPKTVRNYISNIFRKLQVADRTEAIVAGPRGRPRPATTRDGRAAAALTQRRRGRSSGPNTSVAQAA